ncbi:MAG: YHS domain-containing (seleno)protein [Oricola sp.]
MSLTRRASFRLGLAGITILASGRFALAGKINTGHDGLAIEGYDPVAYFLQGKAMRGSHEFTARHDGATYRFASAENRDAFVANPERYAPQYGGFCAFAVSRGATAPVDPQAFTVFAGKLYLNYSKSVRADWQTDIPGNIAKGDANWPELTVE